MSIYEMLGFDPEDRQDQLASFLVDEHTEMLRQISLVREMNGLELEDVAEVMGITVNDVVRIELGDVDLHLSTLRRYAFACGATISHLVDHF